LRYRYFVSQQVWDDDQNVCNDGNYMSNMVGLLLEAAIAYLSRALGSPPYNIGHYDPLLCSLLISDCTDQFLP
jgi:hypothetical protein